MGRMAPNMEDKIQFLFGCGLSHNRIRQVSGAGFDSIVRVLRDYIEPVNKRRRPRRIPLVPMAVEEYKCRCGFVVNQRPCVICAAKGFRLEGR